MWSIHTIEYYASIKRNEAFIQAETWMNFKNTLLSERNQTEKTTYSVNPFL